MKFNYMFLLGNDLPASAQRLDDVFFQPGNQFNQDQLPINFNVSFTHDGEQFEITFTIDPFSSVDELHILDNAEQATHLALVKNEYFVFAKLN